jgi:hypothetical protein
MARRPTPAEHASARRRNLDSGRRAHAAEWPTPCCSLMDRTLLWVRSCRAAAMNARTLLYNRGDGCAGGPVGQACPLFAAIVELWLFNHQSVCSRNYGWSGWCVRRCNGSSMHGPHGVWAQYFFPGLVVTMGAWVYSCDFRRICLYQKP